MHGINSKLYLTSVEKKLSKKNKCGKEENKELLAWHKKNLDAIFQLSKAF